MKLHANAALSLTQRRRMVLRVLEQGWTIKAAAAAEVLELVSARSRCTATKNTSSMIGLTVWRDIRSWPSRSPGRRPMTRSLDRAATRQPGIRVLRASTPCLQTCSFAGTSCGRQDSNL